MTNNLLSRPRIASLVNSLIAHLPSKGGTHL